MKVAFIASEGVPYAKTGGLADVVGSLSQYLGLLGVETKVFMPRYRGIGGARVADLEVELKGRQKVGLFHEGRFFFIDHPRSFQRDGLYGTPDEDYPDNCERFTLFSKAVCSLLRDKEFDIAHCHDWQSGLVPVYLRDSGSPVRTVFTIHNIGYQGKFPGSQYPLLGLDPSYFTPEGVEFYKDVSFLKAGIVYSDAITTVSPTYAREIQNPDFGFGLEGVLQKRSSSISGIINGIDTDVWDPRRDELIYHKFSDFFGKEKNKSALALECRIDPERPLIGMVTRIAGQKGFDILVPVLDDLVDLGYGFVILGSGEDEYCRKLGDFQKKYPGQVSVNIKFDERLAHRIYSGSDFFLMPSQYEPCGLGQMIGMRYGAVPIVHRVGGLADTVIQFEQKTGGGTGFLFEEYSPDSLYRSAGQARNVYAQSAVFRRLSEACMKCDFSWNRSALEYKKLYERLSAPDADAA